MKQNKKFYEPPHMEVVELKSRQTLLTGSVEKMQETTIYVDEDE